MSSATSSRYPILAKYGRLARFLGWGAMCLAAIEVVAAVLGAVDAKAGLNGSALVVGLVPGVLAALQGFFLLAVSEAAPALIDAEQSARHTLELVRERDKRGKNPPGRQRDLARAIEDLAASQEESDQAELAATLKQLEKHRKE